MIINGQKKDKILEIKLNRLHPTAKHIYDVISKSTSYICSKYPGMIYSVYNNIIMFEYNSERNTLHINYDLWNLLDKYYEIYEIGSGDYFDEPSYYIQEEEKMLEQNEINSSHKHKMFYFIFTDYPNENLGFNTNKFTDFLFCYSDLDITKSNKKFKKLIRKKRTFKNFFKK